MKKIKIDLLPMTDDALGLIIPSPTGVLYEHQFGAGRNIRSEVEGFYVPLFDEFHDTAGELIDTLYNMYGEEPNHLTAEGADAIDKIFAQSKKNPEGVPVTSFLSVDRDKLSISYIGWIYVQLRFRSDYPAEQADSVSWSACDSIHGEPLPREGILVFQN
jgi:hypothetical protein